MDAYVINDTWCITLKAMYTNYGRCDKNNVCIIHMHVMSWMKGGTIFILKHMQ